MHFHSLFHSIIVLCFLLHFAQTNAAESLSAVTRQTCLNSEAEQNFRDILSSRMSSDRALIPGFVRAAFHDCITATSSNSNSGCNGSLRLREELRNSDNNRLRRTIDVIRDARTESGACISFADGIQIGTEIGLAIAGDVDLEGQLADLDNPREDVDSPDASTDELSNELPDRRASFATLRAFYFRKGFTPREMVVSLVGGHALGKFTTDGNDAKFTRRQFRFDNSYALNLKQRIDSDSNLSGFNTLESDEAMIATARGRNWIQYYAGQVDDGDEYDDELGLNRTITDFAKFMIKLSQISPDDVDS